MKHQQILDKLSARVLVQAVDEELAYIIGFYMLGTHSADNETLKSAFLPPFLLRWDCILKADDSEASPHTRNIAVVAIAAALHKYGFADAEITGQALDAVDALNQNVILSDDFYRKTPQIKALLSSPPEPLKRRPTQPQAITFYRPKDVVAMRLAGKYYAAYISGDMGTNQAPILEFYDGVFDTLPELVQLRSLPAKGAAYTDGSTRVSRYAVRGMKFLPDPAKQITLIAAAVDTPPSSSHLQPSVGLYELCDIFDLQQIIRWRFHT